MSAPSNKWQLGSVAESGREQVVKMLEFSQQIKSCET